MSKVDLNQVKAGKYRLLAKRWRKVLSKPTEPYDYVQYRQGDIVDLDIVDARRLVKADAVEPVEDEESTGPRPGSVEAILAEVGDDVEKAKAALAAEVEAKGDKARKGLVASLEALIAKADTSAGTGAGTGDSGQGGAS